MKARFAGLVRIRNLSVKRIAPEPAKAFVIKYHYAHGCHKSPKPCYGLFWHKALIGVLLFATPGSEAVRRSVFGQGYEDAVIELHRLVILDITEGNTETWFIARYIELLKIDKPSVGAVVSFADPTEGHFGTIYKASNFLYYGTTNKSIFYLDETGRLRHPRQCGKNISVAEALKRGWKVSRREGKHRYLKFIPEDRRELKHLKAICKLRFVDYPK